MSMSEKSAAELEVLYDELEEAIQDMMAVASDVTDVTFNEKAAHVKSVRLKIYKLEKSIAGGGSE